VDRRFGSNRRRASLPADAERRSSRDRRAQRERRYALRRSGMLRRLFADRRRSELSPEL
jgi:hypothetical protein